MKKILILSLALALVFPASANARVHNTTHHTISSVGKYRYTYHKIVKVKCPFVGCRKTFMTKGK